MIITIFKKLTDTSNPIYADLYSVLESIKTGGDLKDELIRIRSLEGDEYKEAKKALPVIMFTGTFSTRSKDGAMAGSGMAVLDFDDGTEEELNTIRATLREKEYTLSLFSSPRLKGRFKALIRIPVITSDTEYKKYFAALQREYKTIDKSGKDFSRCAFFSYDSDIYINKDAKVWDKQYETPREKKKTQQYQVKDWANVNKALRKIEDSGEGERHLVRTKIAYLFGGFVANKEISYQEAYNLIENAVAKNTTDLKMAMQTVKDCMQAGMDKPLNMSEQRRTLEMTVGLGRRYKPMSEVMDGVVDFYEQGYKRGWEVGWDAANPAISLLRGSTSYVYGSPFSGKSQVTHEMLINICKDEEKQGRDVYCVLLTPETGDVNQVYGELISIAAGKAFTGEYKMDRETLDKWSDFVARHFIVLDFDGDDAKMPDVFAQVEAIEREFNIHIDIVVIDPLNYISIDEGKFSRRDIAISKDLDFLLADARRNNRHNIIVTHSKDQSIERNADGQSYYPIVSPRQILDGQAFFRKAMLMISVYRPIDIKGLPLPDENGNPADVNETQLWIQKAKPKFSSEIGCVKLFYDFKRNKYYEKDEQGREFFAWGEPREQEVKFPPIQEEVKQVPLVPVKVEKSLPINTDFDTQTVIDEIPPF